MGLVQKINSNRRGPDVDRGFSPRRAAAADSSPCDLHIAREPGATSSPFSGEAGFVADDADLYSESVNSAMEMPDARVNSVMEIPDTSSVTFEDVESSGLGLGRGEGERPSKEDRFGEGGAAREDRIKEEPMDDDSSGKATQENEAKKEEQKEEDSPRELEFLKHDSYERSLSVHALCVAVKQIRAETLRVLFEPFSVTLNFQTA